MARKTKKERLAESVEISLEDWIQDIRQTDEVDEEKGACLLRNPNTGQTFCVQTTKPACAKLKGSWIGGPCGG